MRSKPIFSSSEKRPLKRQITDQLKEYEVDNARNIADLLIDIGVVKEIESYLPLLRHEKVSWILELAYNLTRLLINNKTILTSVEKASKVVFALKNYARFDASEEKHLAQVQDGIETVLEIYHNQLKQNIEIVRHYQDVPEILCYPDELIQVWTNLIHNGIQAMKQGGRLTLTIALENEGIKVEVADSGSGIPTHLKDKIFEAFFTTKPTGEGSGLGLHISQKIIDKHNGTIAVVSEPGDTKFTIWLPLNSKQ
jgi:signal transduction histidine kinase